MSAGIDLSSRFSRSAAALPRRQSVTVQGSLLVTPATSKAESRMPRVAAPVRRNSTGPVQQQNADLNTSLQQAPAANTARPQLSAKDATGAATLPVSQQNLSYASSARAPESRSATEEMLANPAASATSSAQSDATAGMSVQPPSKQNSSTPSHVQLDRQGGDFTKPDQSEQVKVVSASDDNGALYSLAFDAASPSTDGFENLDLALDHEDKLNDVGSTLVPSDATSVVSESPDMSSPTASEDANSVALLGEDGQGERRPSLFSAAYFDQRRKEKPIVRRLSQLMGISEMPETAQ